MKQGPLPNPGVPRRRGLPLWTAMVAFGILILICLGLFTALWVYHASEDARTKAQAAAQARREAAMQAEHRKGKLGDELTMAANRRGEVLTYATNATEALSNLLQQTQRAVADALALKTNKLGCAVALHADLLARARRLYETELGRLAPASEVASKLENVRRIAKQLSEQFGTTHLPDPSMAAIPQHAALWADQELRQVAQVQNLVSALIRESQIKVTTATVTDASPTIEAAITQLAQDESAVRQRLLAATEAEANAQARTKEAEAKARGILEAAKARDEQSLAAVTVEAERITAQIAAMRYKANAEITELRKKADSDLAIQRERFEKEIEDKQNQWAIEKKQKDEANRLANEHAEQKSATNFAQARITAALTKVAVRTADKKANEVILRERATDPKVKDLLAPFITPGYWTPRCYTADERPLSYQILLRKGALDDSESGLTKLAKIAMDIDDKVRPRWKLAGGPFAWDKVPESLEKVKTAQMHLRELGQILVEYEMLLP